MQEFNGLEETIDLREYFQVLNRWKMLIIMITLAAVITSAVVSFFILSPVYEAKTIIMVTQPNEKRYVMERDDLEGTVSSLSRLPQMTMNTYIGQIRSEAVLSKVIKILELEKPDYTPATLASMVKVSNPKDSNLIELKVSHKDPYVAAVIANTLAEQFILFISERNHSRMSQSTAILLRQKEIEEENLNQAINNLKDFEAQPRGVQMLRSEFTRKLNDWNGLRSKLLQAQIDLEMVLAGQNAAAKEMASIPATLKVNQKLVDDASMAKIQTLASKLLGEGTDLSMVSEQPNPAYTTLNSMLKTKTVEIEQKKAELRAMENQIQLMETELTGLQSELADREARRDILIREVDNAKKTFDLLNEKITQTQIAQSISLGDTSLLIMADAVQPVVPVKPNKKLNVAIAFLIGLMGAVGLAFVLEFMDNTFKHKEDVEKHLGLPVLGVVPVIKD